MREIPGRIVVFFRWLLSSEQLPTSPDEFRSTGPCGRSFVRWLAATDPLVKEPLREARDQHVLSWVLASEDIPTLSGETSATGARSPSLWHGIFSRQSLPEEAGEECGMTSRTGFLRWVLSSDVCPQTRPSPSEKNGGFLSWLLSREKLEA